MRLYARDCATGVLLVSSPIDTTGQKYAWLNYLLPRAKDKRVLGCVEGNPNATPGVPPVPRIYEYVEDNGYPDNVA